MTAREYLEGIQHFDLTPYSAAPVLCISVRQSHRYASGESRIPEKTAKLLRALIALGRVDV